MDYNVVKTQAFSRWLSRLRDPVVGVAVRRRIIRLTQGNFGDWKAVGGGVMELRIHTGPGYRMYYTVRGDNLILLLMGGTKSDQSKNIKAAIRIAQEWENEHEV